MIYDFHGNFSEIYPIKKEILKNPDRERWGYFWDFEDYLIEDESGRGLTLQGIMLGSTKDFTLFEGLFQRAFRMTTINAKIKNFIISDYTDFSDFGLDFEETYIRTSIDVLSSEIDMKIRRMEEFLDHVKTFIKRKGLVWVSLCPYWTSLIHDETQKFWGDDVFVTRLPDEYAPMNLKELWEELDTLGGVKFDKDMMWEDFSFMYPNFVSYIDPEISKRIDTEFLGTSSEYGLL
jgi:hypothetical protein